MTDRYTRATVRWIALIAITTTAVPIPALAEEIEEIIITAQKREQNAQDVGISIAAYTGDQLRTLGVDSSTELAAMAPGVSAAGSYGGQFLTFSIRGVTQNDFLDHTEAPTSVYVDEAYMAMMTTQQFTLFDIERSEILKGPQGTLFGRNSTGGTVNFVSRKPTRETEGFIDASIARFDQTRVEGAVGGPMSERVSFRVAGLYNRSAPILQNDYPGGGDTWNDESYAGRAHFQFDISDAASLLVTGYGGRSESRSSPWQWSGTIAEVNADGQVINAHNVSDTETRECIGPGGANTDCGNDVLGSPDGFTLTRPVAGGDFFGYREAAGTHINQDVPDSNVNTLELHGATVNFHWDRGPLALISVSDYKVAKKDFQLDGTVSPARGINTIAQADTTSYSQELRLMSSTERVRWVAGLYYLNIDADIPLTGIWLPVDGDTPTIVAAGFQGFQFLDKYNLETQSTSAFGQVEFDFTPKLTAITGVRMTREKKDFEYQSDIYLQTSPEAPRIFNQGMFIAPVRAYQGASNDTLTTARVSLEYKPHEDLLFFASFNRGVKAGGFNAPFGGGAPITDDLIPYGDETLNAYETGFKSTFADGSAQLNASIYYYDYRDYQTFQFIGLTSQVTNNDAEYKGADVDFKVRPTEGLLLQLGASFLDTEVYDVVSFGIVADKESSFAPELQASGLVRYEWPMFGGTASAQGSFSYSSSYYYSLTNFDSLKSDSHTAVNARFGFMLPGDHAELSLFVDNVTDERYDTLRFDLSTSCGCTLATYAKPRVYGLGLRYSF